MPRQRKPYRREAHVFPEDFPQRLEQLKEASGLTWSELARRLGTNPLTLRRWRQGARPNALHLPGPAAVRCVARTCCTCWRCRTSNRGTGRALETRSPSVASDYRRGHSVDPDVPPRAAC